MQQTEDQVITTGPDADSGLIALCAELCRLEECLCDHDNEVAVEVWEDERGGVMGERRELVQRITSVPFTTLDGARAVARAYVAWTFWTGDEDGPDAFPEDRLLGALLKGLAGEKDV